MTRKNLKIFFFLCPEGSRPLARRETPLPGWLRASKVPFSPASFPGPEQAYTRHSRSIPAQLPASVLSGALTAPSNWLVGCTPGLTVMQGSGQPRSRASSHSHPGALRPFSGASRRRCEATPSKPSLGRSPQAQVCFF